MRVKLLADYSGRAKGSIVDLPNRIANRLIALNEAEKSTAKTTKLIETKVAEPASLKVHERSQADEKAKADAEAAKKAEAEGSPEADAEPAKAS